MRDQFCSCPMLACDAVHRKGNSQKGKISHPLYTTHVIAEQCVLLATFSCKSFSCIQSYLNVHFQNKLLAYCRWLACALEKMGRLSQNKQNGMLFLRSSHDMQLEGHHGGAMVE
jgi:hypothetical protein